MASSVRKFYTHNILLMVRNLVLKWLVQYEKYNSFSKKFSLNILELKLNLQMPNSRCRPESKQADALVHV
jgi:hypothetical protein